LKQRRDESAPKRDLSAVRPRHEGAEANRLLLGHSQGKEKALTFQFGGGSKSGLPPGGEWRCLFLARIRVATLRDGPWHTGSDHRQHQGCVEEVDLDVNPASPYNPQRRI
jgi:hypothetical protein